MADGKNLTKAREHLAKGEKTLVKFSFFGNGSKFEDAAECFDDAGKMFVMAKAYTEAGAAYSRAAEMHVKAKGDFDAASSYGKAGEALQRTDEIGECANAFRQSIALYGGAGKCAMAANAAKKLGEHLEKSEELSGAIDTFKQAVDFFDAENRPQAANGCREKVAFLSGTLGAYGEAQAAFEELGRTSLDSNLGKFNAKKWFTHSVLCALARSDTVAASNKLGEFASLDYSFNGTREYMLCEQLCAACDAGQGQAVADAAAEYDKIKRMDTWMVKVLLAIKATVDSDEPSVDDAPDEHEVVHAPPAPAEPDLPPDDDDEDDLPDFT